MPSRKRPCENVPVPTFLVIALLAILAMLGYGLVLLRRIAVGVEGMTSEVQELRLKSRARIGDWGTSPVVDDREREAHTLRRLGRATVGKRVVVGGDKDSKQFHDVSRTGRDDG